MIERREMITICRQIGTMMEVGVDFLRITRALREQTDNPRLLELYDQLDADLKAGESVSQAMLHAPDVFSPFAVSLIRQGEARGDIEGGWHRLADFWKTEAQEDREIGGDAGFVQTGIVARQASSSVMRGAGSALALGELADRTHRAFARVLLGSALLLGCLAIGRALVEAGLLGRRFETLAQLSIAALFLGVAAWWSVARAPRTKAEEALACAFCGRHEGDDGVHLARSLLKKENSICSQCAPQIAESFPRSEAQRLEEEAARNRALGSVAAALPENGQGDLADRIILGADDPLAPNASDEFFESNEQRP